jgi:chemotaxis protein CheD
MQTTVVDVADVRFSDNPKDILEAPSLGSCVGLMVFDPATNIGGVVIFVLPDSSEIQNPKLNEHLYMFADTAIINFFQAAIEKGIHLEQSKRVLVGGGQMLGQRGDFNLGIRNCEAALDTLSKLELEPTHQHIGGAVNRTATLNIKTGMVHISVAGKETEQL